MPARNTKQLNKGKTTTPVTQHYDFSVMKPFVKFGISAMRVIAHALITIVRNIPKPYHEEEKSGKNKIIKI